MAPEGAAAWGRNPRKKRTETQQPEPSKLGGFISPYTGSMLRGDQPRLDIEIQAMKMTMSEHKLKGSQYGLHLKLEYGPSVLKAQQANLRWLTLI